MTCIHGAVRITPFFHCAVIGSNDDRYIHFKRLFNNNADIFIHGFHRLYNSGFIFNMPDNVNIGEINCDETIFVVINFFHGGACYFINRHFRRFIKKGDIFARGYGDSFFPREKFIVFSIKEKADMSGFFGLGNLNLTYFIIRDYFA